jgi:uncharacterized protein YcaQ
MSSLTVVSAHDARVLLLDAQGLLDDPERRAGPQAVAKIIRQLGFVQVDSIQRIERAHHLILGARLDGYRAEHLDRAAFRNRALFEHWTHDASLIPVEWYRYWKVRFVRSDGRLRVSRWFTHRLRGEGDATIARVLDRITREGPLRSEDFERSADKPATGWWDWTPEKTALEFLWHTGRLAIHSRDRFQKIYDLAERVFPEVHAQASPEHHEVIEWACTSALERLGVATPGELAVFWDTVTIAEAAAWCRDAVAAGQVVPVAVESADGSKPRKAVAVPNWKRRVRHAGEAPDRMRLLAPFDPIIRDRLRAQRLFDFDYRFEAFVPAAKRKYGYYVLPVLDGDCLVGRIDPRHDRDAEELVVERVWWEHGIRPTRKRKRKFEAAVWVLAKQIGASDIRIRGRY